MLPPFEHMLRNALVHGIESPEERLARGKPDTGRIRLELRREGAEVLVRLSDDGGGMNLRAIRDKGIALGLVGAEQPLSDEDAMPADSRARLSPRQASSRSRLAAASAWTSLRPKSNAWAARSTWSRPRARARPSPSGLPFTLAISHALVVRTEQEYYALPLPTVEGVLRLPKAEVQAHLGADAPVFESGGQKYRFQFIGYLRRA